MTEASKSILIASSSLDQAVWEPVARELTGRGYEVLPYEADKVADGRIALEACFDPSAGLSVSYAGRPLDLRHMAAAWYRRPNLYSGQQPDKARQLALDAERRVIQYSLWDEVPPQVWLNDPRRISHAEHKLTQLREAQAVGFTVPQTIVSNRWTPIVGSLPEQIIFKPSHSFAYTQDELKFLYTTVLENDPAQLPVASNPFPGFWQPLLKKQREWRITVVGDNAFDAAIYTDADAKDDWRIHQFGPSVQFRHETFPDEQKERCFRYLGRMGLKYGAFDFIEDQDGRITFLECNPNGQYGWLERELGFPIALTIANELGRIAEASA